MCKTEMEISMTKMVDVDFIEILAQMVSGGDVMQEKKNKIKININKA